MKKFLFLLLISLTFKLTAIGQAIQKGDLEIDMGVGIGLYSVFSNEYEDNWNAGIPGVISLGISYNIRKRFGFGLNFERYGFLTDPDSSEKAFSMNYGVNFLYNVMNREKNVITLFVELGISSFRYENYKNEDYVESIGGLYKLGAMYRHFFNENLGYYLKGNLGSYSYAQFENKKGQVLMAYDSNNNMFYTESRQFAIAMIGINVGLGFTYKF